MAPLKDLWWCEQEKPSSAGTRYQKVSAEVRTGEQMEGKESSEGDLDSKLGKAQNKDTPSNPGRGPSTCRGVSE